MTQCVQLDALREDITARVIVIGGGYGGTTVVKGLDPIAEVVLIEQKNQFVHHAVALHAAMDEVWEQAIFVPYTGLLTRGRFVHGAVSRIKSTIVHAYEHDPIKADYPVFAAGSTYPFPVKCSSSNSAVARTHLAQLHENFKDAHPMMLVGGGTVDIESVGKLAHTFPGMKIIIVEKEDTILPSPGYSEELREEVSAQLIELGTRVITGSKLAFLPPHNVGELEHSQVLTLGGEQIESDIWFQCYGAAANTGYLYGTDYKEFLHLNGTLRAKKSLQVVDCKRSYAIGDLTGVRESKRADTAHQRARAMVANLSTLIAGEPPEAVYEPTKKWVILPLGPNMGASQLVDAKGVSRIVDANQTMEIKGADLMVSVARSQLNLP